MKAKRLQVRGHKTRGVIITGLTEEIVTSVDQVLRLIEIGIANRAIGETKMNKGSSRSHTIFRMTIESKPAEGVMSDDKETSSNDGNLLHLYLYLCLY